MGVFFVGWFYFVFGEGSFVRWLEYFDFFWLSVSVVLGVVFGVWWVG